MAKAAPAAAAAAAAAAAEAELPHLAQAALHLLVPGGARLLAQRLGLLPVLLFLALQGLCLLCNKVGRRGRAGVRAGGSHRQCKSEEMGRDARKRSASLPFRPAPLPHREGERGGASGRQNDASSSSRGGGRGWLQTEHSAPAGC